MYDVWRAYPDTTRWVIPVFWYPMAATERALFVRPKKAIQVSGLLDVGLLTVVQANLRSESQLEANNQMLHRGTRINLYGISDESK